MKLTMSKVYLIEFFLMLILFHGLSKAWHHILPNFLADTFIIGICPLLPSIIGMVILCNKVNNILDEKLEY